MSLSKLEKIKFKTRKRVGRGRAAKGGKTAGRGEKGQNKRSKVKPGFEGGQLPLQKRLPYRRGIGNRLATESLTITTGSLNNITPNSLVDKKTLFEAGVVSRVRTRVKIKIVAKGKLDIPLKINLPVTKKAGELIKKAGGSLEHEDAA